MNKIDKLLEKASKFEKIAKNLKFAQQNPLELQKVKSQIQAIKSRVADVFASGPSLTGTPIQKAFADFVSDQKPENAGRRLNILLDLLQRNSTPAFSRLHTSLLGLSSDLSNLSDKYMTAQSAQGSSVHETPTINVEDLPDAPGSKANPSFVQKVNDKISTIDRATQKLVADPTTKSVQNSQYINTLVSSLLEDKKLIDNGKVFMNGEDAQTLTSKMHDTIMKAVDAGFSIAPSWATMSWS